MHAVKMMIFVPKKRLLGIHLGLQFEGVHQIGRADVAILNQLTVQQARRSSGTNALWITQD